MLRWKRILLVMLLVPILAGAGGKSRGIFSRSASELWNEGVESGRPVVVYSPDHQSKVVAFGADNGERNYGARVEGAIGSLQLEFYLGVNSEVLWAPDSRAFFVTTSMGGAVGDFHLFVVDSFDGKLQSREITPLMYKEFGHPFRCDAEGKYHEVPNIGGIGWVGDTHHVWVAAEVMPHSVCDSDGTFRAYEVDPAAMRVLQTLNQLEAKRQLWAMLGEELRAAPDECVRKPRSCLVLTNHPELYPK